MKYKLPILINGTAIRESEYIFVYTQMNGFSGHRLTIDLFVNEEFDYELYLDFSTSKATAKDVECLVKGPLPITIKQKLKAILRYPKLDYFYGDAWEDMQKRHFFFNTEQKLVMSTIGVIMNNEDKIEKNKSFFEFYDLLSEWIDKHCQFQLSLL